MRKLYFAEFKTKYKAIFNHIAKLKTSLAASGLKDYKKLMLFVLVKLLNDDAITQIELGNFKYGFLVICY